MSGCGKHLDPRRWKYPFVCVECGRETGTNLLAEFQESPHLCEMCCFYEGKDNTYYMKLGLQQQQLSIEYDSGYVQQDCRGI